MANTTRKYDDVAAQIRRDILAGRYSRMLPGVHGLSLTYGVNFKTVSRALMCLEETGLVKTVCGEGRMIVADEQILCPKTVVLLMRTKGHLYAERAIDIARQLQSAGLHALLIDFCEFQGTVAEVQRILNQHPVALVIQDNLGNATNEFYVTHADRFARTVVLSQEPIAKYSDAMTVRADIGRGIYLATRHLIEQGRRRILFLLHEWMYPDVPHSTSYDRMKQGYETALAESGLSDAKRYLMATSDLQAVLDRIRQTFREPERTRPDGLVTYIDFLAVNVIRQVQKLGLRVPEDVAVVGYNNTPWCNLCEVPLSSMDTRTTETARLVVQCLTGEYEPGRVLTVEPRLVKRVSSGASHAESGRMRSDEGVVAAIMEPCEGR